MRTPIFICPFTGDQWGQILLASVRGGRAPIIARRLGCYGQTMRNVIHGFNASGLAILERSSRPHRLRTAFTEEGAKRLKPEKVA